MPRWFRRAVVAVALLALAAGTSGDVFSVAQRADGDETVFAAGGPAPTTTTAPPPTTTTTQPQPAEWTVFAGGDVLMDRSEAAGRDPFDLLVPPLEDADLSLVNSEMAVADGGTAEEGKEFTFRAPASAATTMANAGIDVVSLANNHALDFGSDALLESIANLRGADITPLGAGADAENAFAPAVFEIGGDREERVSIAIVAASDVVPDGWGVGGRPGIATTRQGALVDAVEAAVDDHDVVLVMVHWGVEGEPCPNQGQVDLGDELLDAGAAVVIGSHPHVLQPIARRGEGLVAYSMGNLAWHPRPGPAGQSALLELRFVGTRFDGFTVHPHVLDENGDPEPAGVDAAETITAALDGDDCDLP